MTQTGERIDNRIGVLFVDDEPNVLDGLRRQFRSRRGEWDMRFAASAAEALGMLGERPADVVVSDMRMPERNGASLLREVQDRWPTTARFILSGQTDHAEIIGDIGAIHQFLQKPCEPEVLSRAIIRCRGLSSVLESPELKSVTSSLRSLPVVSGTYTALTEALQREDVDVDVLTSIVERDIGLTTKLLQMVNSAFFGMPRRFTRAREAVNLVGSSNLRMLALTAQIVDSLSADSACHPTITSIWKASADIGAKAGTLAKASGQPSEICNAARLTGTLSLVGRGILARYLPDRFESALALRNNKRIPLHEAELEIMHAGQQTIGAYALGLWGFHDDIVESVARQYDPQLSTVSSPAHPLAYLHLARTIVDGSAMARPIPRHAEWVASIGIDPGFGTMREAA